MRIVKTVKVIAIAMPLLMLAACKTVPLTPEQEAQLQSEECGAPTFQYLVGTPAQSLNLDVLPPYTRVIYPYSAVTMDFNPMRLNVYVNDEGFVTRLSCG
ncbi:I78 family peptidase inhibitor [Paenalcaligenes sp. Me131]|uniref:I78 family peptidase inhibitor n=1 Tax=Paenalcaligenes sp. Me131 TaxID=3392636 RepID=UPI003D26FF13